MPTKTTTERYREACEQFATFILEHAGTEYTAETYLQVNKLREKIARIRAKLEQENQNAPLN